MTDSESKSQLRFGLRELLLMVTVFCLGVGLFFTVRRLRNIETEVKLIREEVGRLTIDDSTQVHVLALGVDEPNTWQWRMFIPKGQRYKWKGAYANIPVDGVPKSGPKQSTTGISNDPYWETDNEVLITAKLRQADTGGWRLSVGSKIAGSRNQMYGFTLSIPEEEMEWTRDGSTQVSELGSPGQDVVDPKGPIVLLRQRATKLMPDGTYEPVPEPMPGFVIWLEKY